MPSAPFRVEGGIKPLLQLAIAAFARLLETAIFRVVRDRELDFDLAAVPVSARTAKGITLTKWTVKDVKAKFAK